MATVLLIDDEDDVRAELRAQLEAFGHQVAESRDGRDGCRLAERERFDCAIVDVFMPAMDGLETIQILKILRPDMALIVLAGEGRVSARLACRMGLALGADHALRKPVDGDTLDALLTAKEPLPGSQVEWEMNRA